MYANTYFDELFNLRNAFDRFFSDSGTARTQYPLVNVYETDDAVTVQALVPGIQKEDIEIRFENGVLTLSGTSRQDRNESMQYLREERQYGGFHKAIKINAPVDPESISARMENGVLGVNLKKKEQAKPRKIEIA